MLWFERSQIGSVADPRDRLSEIELPLDELKAPQRDRMLVRAICLTIVCR